MPVLITLTVELVNKNNQKTQLLIIVYILMVAGLKLNFAIFK